MPTGAPIVPIAFSFTNGLVVHGYGAVTVVTGSSADSGFTTELTWTTRTLG